MFEKKKKKLSLLDKLPSSYEDITSDKERWHRANRIYYIERDKMFRINPIGILSDIDTDEFISHLPNTLTELVFMNKVKLFTDKENKLFSPRLPEELRVKPQEEESKDEE